jgi:hypothetical protein
LLNEGNLKSILLECQVEAENDWQKVEKAIDNIRIGDLKCSFSLPIEFTQMLEKLPRRVFSARNYEVSLSPKSISFKLKDVSYYGNLDQENKNTTPNVNDAINEGEANFKLFLGAYLGAMQKPSDNMKTKVQTWFEFPSENFLSKLDNPLLDKLNETNTGKYIINGIFFYDEKSETYYRLSEDLNTQKTNVSIEKSVNSPPSALNFMRLLQEIYSQGNNVIKSVRV